MSFYVKKVHGTNDVHAANEQHLRKLYVVCGTRGDKQTKQRDEHTQINCPHSQTPNHLRWVGYKIHVPVSFK